MKNFRSLFATSILPVIAMAFLAAALISTAPVAQDRKLDRRIAGSWLLVDESLTLPGGKTIKSWGDKPYGYLNFDGRRHFSMMVIRSDLPRFKSRTSGTQEQNDTIAKGVLAYYGTYSTDTAASTIAFSISGSSFAAFNAITSLRKISFVSPDRMTVEMTVPGSKVTTKLVWQRAK